MVRGESYTMVTSIVIGLGETGGPLQRVLRCEGYDFKLGPFSAKDYDVLHICLPYSKDFLDHVAFYQDETCAKLIIIHSTVPIGTTNRIPDAVHSPILGKHGNMEDSIRRFIKWVGGPRAEEAAAYLRDAGLTVKTVPRSEETEALKLLCLAKYGMSIAFAEYEKKVLDYYGVPFDDMLEWDTNYNAHVCTTLQRPIITPPNGKIGGHCVVQNTKILNAQHPNPILEEVLKYE